MTGMSVDVLGRRKHIALLANQLPTATWVVSALGAAASLAFLHANPIDTFCIAALLWGWAEINGLCGYSHLCSLSMLRAWNSNPRLWLYAACAYTIGGLLSASIVGAIVGLVALFGSGPSALLLLFASTLVVPLVARELGWISFPLPQVNRQTNKMWALEFGFIVGAGMWGAHIGLGFATVVRHGGFCVLVPIAAALGPVRGALVFALYWLGRTLPIWANLLIPREKFDATEVVREVESSDMALRVAASVGLLASLPAALLLVLK